MQSTATVRIQRNATPLFGIFAVTLGILLTLPLFLSSPAMSTFHAKSGLYNAALKQPIYQEFARAIDLMQTGQTEAAGTLLDKYRSERFIITSGGYAEGVMAADSPTTLLMRLGRTIKTTALDQARMGRTEESLVWVARLHTLADQALNTPVPSNTALQMAYFMKSTAYRTEKSVWEQTGNSKRAAGALEKDRRIERLWNTRILPRIASSWNTDLTDQTQGTSPTTPSTVVIGVAEATTARQLLRTMTIDLSKV